MAVTTSPSTASESRAPTWETASPSTLTWLLAGGAFLAIGSLLLLLVSAQSIAADVFTVGAATSVGRLRPAAVLAVVTGRGNGRVGFEMPRGLAVVLAVGQLLVLGSVLRTISKRVTDDVHPSMWFVVGALFSAPFVILGGALPRVHGVNDEIVLAFGLSGLKTLWLVPLAIGLVLYVVPITSRSPLYSGQLAAIAFWGWFVFAPFAGPVRLLGGPSQDWLESVGIAATIALGVPVLALVVLVAGTYARRTSLAHAVELRFALAGTGLLALWAVLSAATGNRTAGSFLHASVFADGLAELALLGVAGAGILAGTFHVLPAVSGNHLANPHAANAAVWPLAVGATVVALSLLAAGYVQGVLAAQGVTTGAPVTSGEQWGAITNAIRPLLWLRVIGEGLVMLALVTAFQQVFSTSTAGDPLAPEES